MSAANGHWHRTFEWHEGFLRCAVCHEPATGDDVERSDW